MTTLAHYVLSIGTAALLAGCVGSQIPVGGPAAPTQSVQAVRQFAAPAAADRLDLLAMTRKVGNPEANYVDKLVKVREFKLPHKQSATDSIIVGPDGNLWFADFCSIAQVTIKGKIRIMASLAGGSEPGLLTVGPDGNVWANSAQPPLLSCLKYGFNEYVIYRVSPDARLTVFSLPTNANIFPTALINIDSTLYFGLGILGLVHGNEEDQNFLATISTRDGIIDKLAEIHKSHSVGDGYIMALRTPGPKIWFYDFQGGLHICSTAGTCSYRLSENPYKYVGTLYGTVLAYSPKDHDVYIDNQNFWKILKYTLDGKPLRGYKNLAFAQGFGTVTYYRGNIWVTLGGDDKARPNLGRLTPSGKFSEISLPFFGPTAAVTALVGGPDGHLWYLRGDHVGEILSKI